MRMIILYTLFTVLLSTPLFAIEPSLGKSSASDSFPVFQPDSLKSSTIRSLEAGGSTPAKTQTLQQTDSLEFRLRNRKPFLGLVGSLAFADFSGKSRFSSYRDSVSKRDSLVRLQNYDPVSILFPLGLTLGYPIFPYLDLWLQTEHFWFQQSSLAQKSNHVQEFSYTVQGHLLGLGGRFLIPNSFLTVTNQAGLFVAYTHFWPVGPTEIYAPTGKIRAQFQKAGAGYEIKTGFQQEFAKRWSYTGGLAFSHYQFRSPVSWKNILPYGSDEKANWTLNSMRICLEGFYQIGGNANLGR